MRSGSSTSGRPLLERGDGARFPVHEKWCSAGARDVLEKAGAWVEGKIDFCKSLGAISDVHHEVAATYAFAELFPRTRKPIVAWFYGGKTPRRFSA